MKSKLSEELKNSIITDEYFLDMFRRLEREAANRLFDSDSINQSCLLSDLERSDVLRFADILSHSQDPEARNKSYKIITLLSDSNQLDESFRLYSEAILSKIGNFPGLKYLQDKYGSDLSLPIEREIEREYKGNTQKTTDGNYILTDAQYNIVESIDKYDYYSFSGPTSIGKTFIIRNYIAKLAQKSAFRNSSVVVLVPSRALISQVADELRRQIDDKTINISTFPTISDYTRMRYASHILIFTPERLLSYVSSDDAINIKYLFVDEAQKIVSVDDSRSSLYYHSIYEVVRRFATKVIFASPNIPNPEIFLGIFEKDRQGVFATTEQTVSQNRYYIDLIDNAVVYYSDSSDIEELAIDTSLANESSETLIARLGFSENNIVYCNSPGETVERALRFSKLQETVADSKEVKSLISFLNDYVHKDYYLIECLKKGVAYHHGRMPQKVRNKVEELFSKKESALTHIFCTSTLLEGVNLPAKNIFVVNDSRGLGQFKKIDFENLIGRAGRLTKEFSGNVICIRDVDGRWKNERQLISRSKLPKAESFLINKNPRRIKEFSNISKALLGQPLATGLRVGEEENINHYASIVLLHQIEDEGSLLRAGLLNKKPDARTLLQESEKKNNVPAKILRVSSTINPIYQNRVLQYLSANNNHEDNDISELLNKLYVLYSWGTEESSGKDPLIPSALHKSGHGEKRLNYWSMLMNNWIKGEPFSKMVGHSIYYYKQRGEIWFTENGRPTREDFVGNPKQINIIIELIMNDIENGLRFKIKRYLLNYYLLKKEVLGSESVGTNYAELVEYGTSNKKEIELQVTGLSRGAAQLLIEKHEDAMLFDDTESLVDINLIKLAKVVDISNEYSTEIISILGLNIAR